MAMASKDEAMASQMADSASAPNGYIQADSRSRFHAIEVAAPAVQRRCGDASARVDSGSMEGYSDLASASANGITASQQMDGATGEQIQTKSQSESWTASLFQGLKKTADAKVSTTV